MSIIVTNVFPVAVVVAEQSIRYQGVCPYPTHLFIDVLAKVGYIQNATAIVEVCINQVFPEAFDCCVECWGGRSLKTHYKACALSKRVNWVFPTVMLVIVSVRRLDNDRIEIGVARPQHDSNRTHNYPSEKEARAVLADFGISEELMASDLKLLAQMGPSQQLKFPSMNVPQHELRSKRFRLLCVFCGQSIV